MKGRLPLEGLTIVDMTHQWAGPHATRVLADFGAEVIRVEYTKRLCLLRGGRKENRAYDRQPNWFQINRNKLSITLDLNDPKDRESLWRLVEKADIFVENSRTGVMDSFGFGFGAVSRVNQGLIYLSMSGFGNSGPYSGLSGYGATFEAMSGIQSLTAYAKGGRPYRIKEMDIINGIAVTAAIMTALAYRQRTGEGQHIDFSHMEGSSHALIGEHLLEHSMNGSQTLPVGNRHQLYAPHGCYRCKGEDRWVAVSVRSDAEWAGLCEAIGRPGLSADPRFSTAMARMEHHGEADSIISEWASGLENREAMRLLQEKGVPAGAVLDAAALAGDPHLKERAYFVEGVSGSDKPFMGFPFKMNFARGRVAWRGPDLGEHNREVLSGRLGRTDIKEIDEREIGTAFDPE